MKPKTNHASSSRSSIPPPASEVADIMAAYPAPVRKSLLLIRRMIYETAAATQGVGDLTETLKWREPAYLTTTSGSGSTIRIGWKPSKPAQYALYFNCNTTLVGAFRRLYSDELNFEGNRAIILQANESIPAEALRTCLAMALNYHRDKRR